VLRRISAADLHAGNDVEGFYPDDSTGGTGFPTGVWPSPSAGTLSAAIRERARGTSTMLPPWRLPVSRSEPTTSK
jgi:hypothetical protein